MMGREAVLRTFARASASADVAIVEGMMGLYDGASARGDAGSTAEIAKWLAAPVVLVVDAQAMARSLAAVALGFARFDPEIKLAAVIANRVGGRGHLDLLREACPAPPVVGGLPLAKEVAFPERHLGLITAANRTAVPEDRFRALGALCSEWIEVSRLLELARAAPPLPSTPEPLPAPAAPRCRIALAWDEAFHFYYEDNLARLEQAGAALLRFSPIHDPELPACDGLYLGGGYPEVHAAALARNQSMQQAVRALAARGAPIYAECGGLMYLCAGIVDVAGGRHPMVGLVPGDAVVSERLQALGYVEVETLAESPLGPGGLRVRGHEFRYSRLVPAWSDALAPAYRVCTRPDAPKLMAGHARGSLLASYVHLHFASQPGAARALCDACAAFSLGSRPAPS
jgi:cobyrinic acid a,c-diamide synthase